MQSSITLSQNKEIDILAISADGQSKLHVEVSVSVRMQDFQNSPKTKAEDYANKKFNNDRVRNKAEELLGVNYSRKLVVGDITLEDRNALDEFTEECSKLNVEVHNFTDILNEVRATLGTRSLLNAVIKTTQLCSNF